MPLSIKIDLFLSKHIVRHTDYGESETKTVDNRFWRSDVSRCEQSKPSVPRRSCATQKQTGENPQNLAEVLGEFTPLSAPKKESQSLRLAFWSGLRGSNPPPPPWQGGALPNELNPHIKLATRMGLEPTTSSVTG